MSVSLNTIPASQIVNVVPSVLAAGGSQLDLIGLMLTSGTRVPIGQVLSFPSAAAVSSYFGATSTEAVNAAVYFNGPLLSTTLPDAVLFAQYPTAPVGAYLRGGNISGLTLAQLQALTGVLTISIDGTPVTSSSINLSAATSLSNAAQIITNALGTIGPTQATFTGAFGAVFVATGAGANLTVASMTSGTIHPGSAASASITGTGVPANTYIVSQTSGTPGGAGVYVTNNATTASSATITATSTTMDVSAVATGALAVGQEITGAAAGTYITALGDAFTTGGAGTYITTVAQELDSTSLTAVMPTVTYDSIAGAFLVISNTTGTGSTIGYGSGTIAASLLLTQATGAVLSQGAIAAVPATFMANIVSITQNWATFLTLFDPDAGSGNTQKQAFAAWVNSTNNRYAYIAVDTDITPTESTAATSSLGYILKHSNSSGTICIYEPAPGGLHHAAFIAGYAASIDFNATNGRETAAFRGQSGLALGVTNGTASTNLIANDYNFYGAYATAAQQFNWFVPGQITGPFLWIDSYLNQIWLNNELQLALMVLLSQMRSIPYNPVGYGYIREALTAGASATTIALPPPSPVAAALNAGVIRQNVPLSSTQIQFVNAAAGMAIDQLLSTQGWYLLIQPATPTVRQARGSPPMTLFYMDGESIQKISLASVEVQ